MSRAAAGGNVGRVPCPRRQPRSGNAPDRSFAAGVRGGREKRVLAAPAKGL